MRSFLFLALSIFSSFAFANGLPQRILQILPEGQHEGRDCLVNLGSSYGPGHLDIFIGHPGFQEHTMIFEDAEWFEVKKDRSREGQIDVIYEATNTHIRRRLLISKNLVRIEALKKKVLGGHKVEYVVECVLE